MNTPIGTDDTLSTKADLARMEGALKADIAGMELALKTDIVNMGSRIHADLAAMDKKFTVYFSVLIFTVIFVNRNTLEFLARLAGLIK